ISHFALLTKSPTLSRNHGEKSTSRPRLSLTTPRVLESIFLNSLNVLLTTLEHTSRGMYGSKLDQPPSHGELGDVLGDGVLVKIVFSGCGNHVLDSSLDYVAMIIGSSNGSTEGFTWHRFCQPIGSEFVRNTIGTLVRWYSCWHMFNYAHFHFPSSDLIRRQKYPF